MIGLEIWATETIGAYRQARHGVMLTDTDGEDEVRQCRLKT